MEKVNFVKNGVLRLPPGFRFRPTDEELVVQYLRRKVHSLPMPVSIIPEVDVCMSDPWDLLGDVENERFFFSTKEVKYPTGNRSNRATLSGCWKAQGLDKQIVSYSNKTNDNNPNNNQQVVVGMKKTLVFYKGKPSSGTRTNWIMHEYRLASQTPQTKNLAQVLCRIFLKKRGTKNEEEKDTKETTEVENVDKNVEMMKPKMKPGTPQMSQQIGFFGTLLDPFFPTFASQNAGLPVARSPVQSGTGFFMPRGVQEHNMRSQSDANMVRADMPPVHMGMSSNADMAVEARDREEVVSD
ncbi:NAC domain-containing protein 83 [Tanacetum coccineum]|uniref:NAC domain-containing protein 83 n=1 Tax=Tanacetum coccineum TaxID=301880 RepID=A0ABQ5CCC1_9ASTR